jgi:hypothetical protein
MKKIVTLALLVVSLCVVGCGGDTKTPIKPATGTGASK